MTFRIAAQFMGLCWGGLLLVGCASPNTYRCDDACGESSGLSGRYDACGGAPCDGCGPVVAEAGPCLGGCEGGVAGAGPCGTGCGTGCGPRGGSHTISGLFSSMVTCNAGCGEVYWGEWCYDPPDACDPCDDGGNFVGAGCCRPSCWARLWAGIVGTRHCPVGCMSGCSACCDVGCDVGRGHEPTCGCDDCGGSQSLSPEFEFSGPIQQDLQQLEPIAAPQFQDQPSVLTRRNTRPYYDRDPQSRLVRRPRQ